MKTQTVMEKDQDFDSQLSDCIDRALFILSTSQKKFLLLRLEDDYGLPSADFGKHPEKLEAALKRILGETVTANILTIAARNIGQMFQIRWYHSPALATAIEQVRIMRNRES